MSNETDLWRGFRAAHAACALLALKLRPKFASLLDSLEDLTIVYACAPIDRTIDSSYCRHWRLRGLQMRLYAESVSRDVSARRRQTVMPAPQPSAKRLCNDPLVPEAADVDWVFGIGIP